jgi:hypothetical protein
MTFAQSVVQFTALVSYGAICLGGSMTDNVYGIGAHCRCIRFVKAIAGVEDLEQSH